jgi:hypothetical protein
MSALRISRVARATALQPVFKLGGRLISVRYASGSKDPADPASDINQDTAISRQEPGIRGLPEHGPNFDAHVDHATSYEYSLVINAG